MAITSISSNSKFDYFYLLVIYFFNKKQPTPQQSQPQPLQQQIPQLQHNPNPDVPIQMPQQILHQLQDMLSQRQLVNVNHNQLALR